MIPKHDIRKRQRREKQKSRFQEDKQLLQMMAEYKRLHRAVWKAPSVELETPYQRGWYRYLVLKEKASRRPDYDDLLLLLEVVNQVQYCRKKKFLRYCEEQNGFVSTNHRTKRFHLWDLLRLKMPDRLFRYFVSPGGLRSVNRELLRSLPLRGWTGKFEVNCEHLFESVVAPYIVTHRKVDLPDVKARLAELEEIFEQTDGWHRFHRLKGVRGYHWERGPCYRRRDRLIEKEMRQAALDHSSRVEPTTIRNEHNKTGARKFAPFSLPRGLVTIASVSHHEYETENYRKASGIGGNLWVSSALCLRIRKPGVGLCLGRQ